jgi:pseudaminic acid biosynthesis-associated methylase
MGNTYKTEQEAFWAGEFGDEYVTRNHGEKLIAGNLALFTKILSGAYQIRSVIEFGSNIGLNLLAIRQLLPEVDLSAIEINRKAAQLVEHIAGVTVYNQSILDFIPDRQRDFVFIKGVLIHINPEMLPQVYDLLYRTSSRYISLTEYYNPTPVSVPYRGHGDVLFKRDFAGEMLDRYEDLRLVSYGFSYHRDNNFPQGDANWFLLEKSGR